MSSEIKQVLKDPRFRHLKMSEHTFQCYLGLWRGININSPEDLHFPIPPLAGTLPLKVAMWNNLKDGGDNLTKLADICQEKNGVRSDNLVACTGILLNIGLVFHRCNQMCTFWDPSFYPTLLHSRNAANQRFSSKDSLKVIGNILLQWANQKKEQEELSPVELINT